MEPLNTADIIAKAREMRAEEMRRMHGEIGERLGLLAKLAAKSLGAGISALAEAIRPFFTWNPQEHRHS